MLCFRLLESVPSRSASLKPLPLGLELLKFRRSRKICEIAGIEPTMMAVATLRQLLWT